MSGDVTQYYFSTLCMHCARLSKYEHEGTHLTSVRLECLHQK